MAKEIMISRMAEPPTLAELSKEIGLSLKKLKEGFTISRQEASQNQRTRHSEISMRNVNLFIKNTLK